MLLFVHMNASCVHTTKSSGLVCRDQFSTHELNGEHVGDFFFSSCYFYFLASFFLFLFLVNIAINENMRSLEQQICTCSSASSKITKQNYILSCSSRSDKINQTTKNSRNQHVASRRKQMIIYVVFTRPCPLVHMHFKVSDK